MVVCVSTCDFSSYMTFPQLVRSTCLIDSEVPNDAAALFPLTTEEDAFLSSHNVKVHKVDWVVPPNMRHTLNQVSQLCCGS